MKDRQDSQARVASREFRGQWDRADRVDLPETSARPPTDRRKSASTLKVGK